MKYFSFFLESIRVASKFGRADFRTDLDSAERLIDTYCVGGSDREGQSISADRIASVHGALLSRG